MSQDRSTHETLSLYKYVSISTLKRILQGTVRFTQPSAFNDPFELLPEIVIPENEPEKQFSVSFDLGAARRQPPPGELHEVPAGCGASDSLSRDIVKQLNDRIGIFCLSRAADLILMWSHYADQYSGAVVEFDGRHSFFDHQIDVEYRPTRPLRHISAYVSDLGPVPVAELCVKSDQWSYEREVRIVRTLSSCRRQGDDLRGFAVYTQDVPPGCIKSVILGERTPVPEQRAIYEAVRNAAVGLTLAAVDHRGYAFRRELIKLAAPEGRGWPVISPRTAHIFTHLDSPLGEMARAILAYHPMSEMVNKPV